MQPSDVPTPLLSTREENTIITLLAAVQFVNIVDFMMVMPLGPELASGLGMSLSHLGIVAACYTGSAAVSGIVSSSFIDRFDRKKALIFCMLGLIVGTCAGAFSWNLTSLLISRVVAGAFGGPASSLTIAIVSDIIPASRRGKALSSLMIAFSLATIFGVPVGLELAKIGTWHTPFYVLSAVGLLCAILISFKLPSLRFHLQANRTKFAMKHFLTNPKALTSYGLFGLLMMSGFMLFPNFAAYLQKNLGFPRSEMSVLYLCGGLASLVTLRFVGGFVDRFGADIVFGVGTILFIAVSLIGFSSESAVLPSYVFFVVLMLAGNFRNVAAQTISSMVPNAEERAGFMSIQSAVQHSASALGGLLSAQILIHSSETKLVGMGNVALVSSILSLLAFCAMISLRKKVIIGQKP